ncbi:MAG: RNA polymerase sigma factor [Desulfocapsaceae bacterium]|nr:RNA polymerase sigma factor [Desulfocapsaceae bacterium]
METNGQNRIKQLYNESSRQILATLIRLLGDFDLAEECMHESFAVALKQWPEQGIPENPVAWLISTGRFKGIDQLRRKGRIIASENLDADISITTSVNLNDQQIRDDQLRLIFTCCHPSLSVEAQLALTLREVCGLTTEEIAQAFISKPATIAQRIVRAKNKIQKNNIPYEIPEAAQINERLRVVLQVIYLVFNEGYTSSTDTSHDQYHLTDVAVRLARKVVDLLPAAEAKGLLALMLLQDSRKRARVDENGDLVTLENQDRSQWNSLQIAEGCSLTLEALSQEEFGTYTLQAAIAAVHAEAPSSETTDWCQIEGLYEVLLRHEPSPVIELNYGVATAMCKGYEIGLEKIEAILARGELQNYRYAHAAKADLLRRLGKKKEAARSYRRALELTLQKKEKRYLEKRIAELSSNEKN